MPQAASHIFPTSTYFIQDKCTVWISLYDNRKKYLKRVRLH